jgi:glycosyltransferase involved in cell wall biosynthesis
MITIDKLHEDFEDTLPISVIVPMSEKRSHFFNNMVYPLFEANKPAEIIVNNNLGGAPKKRNDGYDKSTQPYLFFCDDDILLPKDLLEKLYKLLLANPNKAYAYTGYHGIVIHPNTHPMRGNFQIPSIPFNGERLKQGNYISTMSLIRRDAFPRFDESLKRLQDWSLWLTMLENGHEGIMLGGAENMFYAYYLDEGITSNGNSEREALMAVVQKHKLM